MSPASRQSVQVERHRRDECLALTRSHLGCLAVVQPDPTDELHIVGNHVPEHLLTRYRDLGPDQPPARVLHHREGLRKDVFERVFDHLQ